MVQILRQHVPLDGTVKIACRVRLALPSVFVDTAITRRTGRARSTLLLNTRPAYTAFLFQRLHPFGGLLRRLAAFALGDGVELGVHVFRHAGAVAADEEVRAGFQ